MGRLERRYSLYNVLLQKTLASGLGGMVSALSHRKGGTGHTTTAATNQGAHPSTKRAGRLSSKEGETKALEVTAVAPTSSHFWFTQYA